MFIARLWHRSPGFLKPVCCAARRGYALFSLGRNISPLPAPRQKHELVTSGMYNYVRHPLYAGLLMIAFGLAIITRNETRLAMAALLWVILEKKVSAYRALCVRQPCVKGRCNSCHLVFA